ncbi:unnamed protein product [Rhizoctonia solani]|uniref:Ran GTPase-activating protein 1 n=1 Tax=Rhizoctonia solani TaxID=456999 RepID=A0A8H2XY00_9AGAM|nr:unnamed protein product [Rhizoctonia solani]
MASTTPSGTYADPSRVFTIHGKSLTLSTREDIEPYIKQMREIKDLEEVHFGGNTLGVEACKAIAEVLKEVDTIKIADFHDIFTRRLITEIPQALSAICDALKDKKSLVELNLSDNAFGGRSAEPMVPFLTHNRHFQVFKLNNNGLGIAGGEIVANALLANAEAAKAQGIHPTPLRTVICGRNRLENGSAPFWARAFAAHGGLTEVRMPQNGIRMEGIAEISKGLASCPNLQVLDLQDNTCTESGSRAVAESLKSWPDLRTLNLSDCLLSPKGGVALATALKEGRCTKLETLKVQYGEWDHRAISILAEAIKEKLPNLTALELNGNRADPEDGCITNIRDALESHDHGDALDELDDMEEFDEEEAEREEEEAEVKRGDASDEEEEKEKESEVAAKVNEKLDDAADSLAELMGKVRIGDYTVPGDIRKLSILRIAALQGAAYQWQQHESVGHSEGLTSTQLKLIRDPAFSPYGASAPSAFSAKQIAALKFADASTRNSHVNDEVWNGLAKQFPNAQQITESVLTVSAYNLVSRFLLAVSVDGVAEMQVPYPA